MAVETRFIVIRKGEEKMTFASKKEADAFDKMLDMAEAFTDWLSLGELQLDEVQVENLALYLAEHKEAVQHILRTSKLPEAQGAEKPMAQSSVEDASNADGDKKIRPIKAA